MQFIVCRSGSQCPSLLAGINEYKQSHGNQRGFHITIRTDERKRIWMDEHERMWLGSVVWRFAEASWTYKNSGTLKPSVISREYKVNATHCTGEYSMGTERGGSLTTVVGNGGCTGGIFMSGDGGWVPGVGGGSSTVP